MLNKFKSKKLPYWAIASSLILLSFGGNTSISAEAKEPQINELEAFCRKFPHNSVCPDPDKLESYIFLEKWKQNETLCSLTTKENNSEKKCKVEVEGNTLKIYLEDGVVSETLPNTLKTKTTTIDLDEIFAFDTQWWLADVEVTRITTSSSAANSTQSGNNNLPSYSSKTASNTAGAFTMLQIGFIPQANSAANSTPTFLTVSSKRLHQIIEQMEAWRSYLPDLAIFENQIKAPVSSTPPQNIAGNVAKLEQTNQCPGCDLRNADLSEWDLENANLQGANLAGANLAGTKLKSAYLLGANLSEASLIDANLETANLMFASLPKADLSTANLKGANLQNSDLTSADLQDAELKAKDLQATSLKNANLDNANLSNADLRCANFQSASLKNANLTNIDLGSCSKEHSLIFSSQLSNVRLNGASNPYNVGDDIANVVNLFGGFVSALNNPAAGFLTSLSAPTVKYRHTAYLSEANLDGANLTDADLSGASLDGANLSNTNLTDTKFKSNFLSNTNFIATNIEEVKFDKPILICEAIFSDESIYEEYCQPEAEESDK